MSARYWTIDFLLEWRTLPHFLLWLHHAVRSLVGSCKSELRTTFPIKVSWHFAIWFWMVGMLNNPLLTSALVIISSFTSDIFIFKIILTLLCRKTSNFESRYAQSAQIWPPQRSRLHGIDRKIRYLDLRSTEASSQKLNNTPMEVYTAAILMSTSWSLRRL